MKQDLLIQRVFDWVASESGEEFLTEAEHCPSRDIFQARLDKLYQQLEKNNFRQASILTAVIGEIGNNVFDHNLGSWRDVPGAYFNYDLAKNIYVLGDRGQGIRQTISRVKPDVTNDEEALKIAFTEHISGRQPEQRGNGLKFVRTIIEQEQWRLETYSGDACLKVNSEIKLMVSSSNQIIQGTIIIIEL